MADFKDELSPEVVERLASELAAGAAETGAAAAGLGGATFDRAEFVSRATEGLESFELKARAVHIARALAATMPADPEVADRIIRATITRGEVAGWPLMPVNEYVATAMLDRPDLGLPLLAALTPLYTAEFAIRPFIESHYDTTMQQLRAWTTHPDENVRRLVSEGTRPRLPWAGRLQRFLADPTPAVELLDELFDDEAKYVRLSAANHLNDIAKDHPELALEIAARWSRATTHGDFVVRHGLRTLVKLGNPEALALLGFDHAAPIELSALTCEPRVVPLGETVTISCELRSPVPARAAIDYVVYYQGTRGLKGGKVFKLSVRDLAADTPVTLQKRHAFAHVSIRQIYPGPHRIEIQVNGRVLGRAEIVVVNN